MKFFTSKKLAYLVAASLTGALVGCDGDDGKDGKDGIDGSYSVPAVTSSTETNVNVINYTLGEGQISYEFEITDENGAPINGLLNAQAKVAALTEKGFINNRSETIEGVEDTVNIGGAVTQATEGAELVQIEDGHYTFTVPMAGVNAGTEGIVWLRVGGNAETGIASSTPLVVNKPEGAYTTTTEACYACHVDYTTASNLHHPSYTAQGMDGDVEFVAGCLVCHGSVSRNATNEEGLSVGSYARNTLSKIGHVNHQAFEEGFTVMNCSTCHAEAPINTNVTGPGCIDCHATGGTPGDIIANAGSDFRAMHEAKAHITSNKAITDTYKVTGTPLAQNDAGDWCTTMSLIEVAEDGSETVKDLHSMYVSGQTAYNAATPVNYTGSYLHGVYNDSVIGRISNSYTESYEADGSKTMCYEGVDLTSWADAGLMASLRVSFMSEGYTGSEKDVITVHGYTDVTAQDGTVSDYTRRLSVTDNSCTTCHNSETNFHKNGNFAEGGIGCVACHNNGQDRSSGGSAPGFGPMVHSMHWGVGAQSTDEEGNAVENSALYAIAPQSSCVVCHDGVVDLNAIPNQFMRAKAFHGGDKTKMASPVTANCYACHNDDSALNHMVQNGGTIDETVPETGWYEMTSIESCATCHAEGSSFGIEKYHTFTR